MAWLAPRIASQGFVAFNIDTLTTSDQPASRGRQLLAALDHLTQRSTVRTRIDTSRLGVMGHSMGGGGTLEAADDRPALQAAIPLNKAYLELNNASHFAPNSSNTTIAKYSIAWLKRFVDDDLRYDQFLCPAPRAGTTISEYRDTCPHS
jgi:dienelactone hydrolase